MRLDFMPLPFISIKLHSNLSKGFCFEILGCEESFCKVVFKTQKNWVL